MLVFLAIAIGAFIILCGSLVFGHEHDIGDAGGDVGHDFEGESGGTVSVFSMKVIMTFVMGFGAAGFIARFHGYTYTGSSIWGGATGVALGAVMWGILLLFTRQQASSTLDSASLIGCLGTVVTPIDQNGLGEIALTTAGQYRHCTARGRGGVAIPKGRRVKVLSATGDDLQVEEVTD